MSLDFHQASVPVFLRYLDRLQAMVDAGEAHVRARAADPAVLLAARLAPDMLPFETQVAIAANFALRASFPLAGLPVPPDAAVAAGFEGLRQHIGRSRALLGGLEPARFAAAGSRRLDSQAGEAKLSLPAGEFLLHYALPNFFFHLSAAYAVLRSRGVPLGKRDFDGFHAYPAPGSSDVFPAVSPTD